MREEFARHSEIMQRIVQGAGDVASTKDKAWQVRRRELGEHAAAEVAVSHFWERVVNDQS